MNRTKVWLRLALCGLLVSVVAIGIGARGCGGGSGGATGSSAPNWPRISNPSTGMDAPVSLITDDTYLYIAGMDESPGVNDYQWRIEKRNKSNGALVAGFGTDGAVTNDFSTGLDAAFSITADATYLYIVGMDDSPGINGWQWRIEKRYKITGTLVTAFDTDGVITGNYSAGPDWAWSITADDTDLYIAGYDESPGLDNWQWRIEKRDKTTGALVGAFDTDGIVTSTPATGLDLDMDHLHISIIADATDLYIVGYDQMPGAGDWQYRIEKRNKTTGALDGVFGGGSGAIVVNPSGGDDGAQSIIADDTYLYIVGFDEDPGADDEQWRIEKRLKTTGALVGGFGTGGVMVINPSIRVDEALSITADDNYLYIAGFDEFPGVNNDQPRIEKRNKGDGQLVGGFGTGGVITNNYSNERWDDAYCIIVDGNYLYIVGEDGSPAGVDNSQWRIEKRLKTTGGQ